MLRYYYTKEKDRLYVNDNESGYFMAFNKYTGEWQIPASSFMQVEHDNDDFAEIPESVAKQLSNGASFEKDYKEYLATIALGKAQE